MLVAESTSNRCDHRPVARPQHAPVEPSNGSIQCRSLGSLPKIQGVIGLDAGIRTVGREQRGRCGTPRLETNIVAEDAFARPVQFGRDDGQLVGVIHA